MPIGQNVYYEHGLENHSCLLLRRLRPHLDSLRGESQTLRLKEVPEHAVGQGRGGWPNPRGEE
jgi:hypothetical protein